MEKMTDLTYTYKYNLNWSYSGHECHFRVNKTRKTRLRWLGYVKENA